MPVELSPNLSPKMAQAWRRYFDEIAALQRLMFEQAWMDHPHAQASAHVLLSQVMAVGYNLSVAPRQDFPVFYDHLYCEPMVYNWGLKTPDFVTRYAFVDGARSYRIWGRRKSSAWLEFTAYGRYMTEPYEDVTHLGVYDFDDWGVGADSTFEIIASAQPHDGPWIRLDASSPNNVLHLRELIYDWAREETLEIHIEAIDDAPARIFRFDDDQMARRLDGAARLMRVIIERFSIDVTNRILDAVGKNAFHVVNLAPRHGTNPIADYVQALFDIQPDEALVIETDIPDPKYWGVMAADSWMMATDFISHQSSINGKQAQIDEDGKFRAVISLEDPGVPNWLDPIGNLFGYVIFRWYGAKSAVLPTVKKIPARELRRHLPASTPVVTPQERAEQLRERRRQGLKRFHY